MAYAGSCKKDYLSCTQQNADLGISPTASCPTSLQRQHIAQGIFTGVLLLPPTLKANTMNSIIYIVGLVVIIGAVLSYFGFR